MTSPYRSKRTSAKSLVPVAGTAGSSDQRIPGVLSPGAAVPGASATYPYPPLAPGDASYYADATSAELIEEAARLEGRLIARDAAWGWRR